MHEVVQAYEPDKDYETIKKLIGKKVKKIDDAFKLLKPGQTMVIRLGSGTWKGWYKSLGIKKDGQGWIQRRPCMEY